MFSNAPISPHRWIHFSGLRIISLPPGVFTSDVSWCLRVICSMVKDTTTSFAIILNYPWPYSSQIVAIDGRKQFQYLNSLLRRACRWVIYSIQIKKSSNRKMESAGRTLSSVLSPQPPYNTKKPLWSRCLNIVLNNKTRPLVFGIQSML